MPPERKVDRDAAVVVLERGDDVAPQPMVRQRPREEDERWPSAGRLPGQRPEAGFQSAGFHAKSSFVLGGMAGHSREGGRTAATGRHRWSSRIPVADR